MCILILHASISLDL
uniref:Uncharacterized protein n=1 Tax=Arundo donax TaxID=35708 RepID=A0A0A8YGJ1_ARUDO